MCVARKVSLQRRVLRETGLAAWRHDARRLPISKHIALGITLIKFIAAPS